MFWGEVHRQKRTGEGRVEDFIFAWRSRLNIWRTLPERRARIVETGFIIAEVAFIGRRVTALEFLRSTIVRVLFSQETIHWDGVGYVFKCVGKGGRRGWLDMKWYTKWYMNGT